MVSLTEHNYTELSPQAVTMAQNLGGPGLPYIVDNLGIRSPTVSFIRKYIYD